MRLATTRIRVGVAVMRCSFRTSVMRAASREMGCAAARTLRGGANGTLPASRRTREIGILIGAIAAIEPDSAVLT